MPPFYPYLFAQSREYRGRPKQPELLVLELVLGLCISCVQGNPAAHCSGLGHQSFSLYFFHCKACTTRTTPCGVVMFRSFLFIDR